MLTRIRWAIARWIAPDMNQTKALELRVCLLEIYRWTAYKDSAWARRTAKALGISSGRLPQ